MDFSDHQDRTRPGLVGKLLQKRSLVFERQQGVMPSTARFLAQDFDAAPDEFLLRRAHCDEMPAKHTSDLGRA